MEMTVVTEDVVDGHEDERERKRNGGLICRSDEVACNSTDW